MNSITNIVKRLRESRINEDKKEYRYKFNIPYRQSVEIDYESSGYTYNPKSMEYLDEIVSQATEDFNDAELAQYAAHDRRTENLGITSMTMEFDDEYHCIVTVTTSVELGEDQIKSVISYLEGQMSDGWGEGFEQREIARFTTTDEEWVEDEDSEDGGYYEETEVPCYVYAQFWWYGDKYREYQIELVPDEDSPEAVKESAGKISYLSIDEEKLKSLMKKHGYSEDEFFEFISDIYGLEDGEDFQTGNGYELMFRADTPKDKIEKISKDLRESASDTEEYNGAIIKHANGKCEVHDKEGNKHVTVNSLEHAKYYIDKNMPYAKKEMKESTSMEFATEEEAEEWAEENGYKIDKMQQGKSGKDLIFWLSKLDENTADEWEYYEMPADHKGPWVHPNYSKNYGNGILGFIYPPYEATSNFLKDMTHFDYVAELYDDNETKTIDMKSFDDIDSCKSWLDEQGAYTSGRVSESAGYPAAVRGPKIPISYISVEYTYNGDDVSNYLGHVKVRTDDEKTALKAARAYAMKKHPEDEPRHFVISNDDYTNVDVVDSNGDFLTNLGESTSFTNAGYEWEILDTKGEYTLVFARGKRVTPYVVAWKLDSSDGSWAQGHYFDSEKKAREYLAKQ